jgi:DDE superfamily endonuclease
MNLLNALLMILSMWRPAFCKQAAFIRAKELAFACLCASGRKTITSMAIFLGRSHKLPIADYKFYSDYKWNVEDFFNPILELSSKYIEGEYVSFAVDDTKIHKTGKKIPFASWQADPLGPKFQTNLIWALRYLQISLLLPLHTTSEKTPTRAIPVRFVAAPSAKKPGKKATEADWKNYKALSKKHNLSTTFVEQIKKLKETMDTMGLGDKTMIISSDGSFCNKTCMAIDDPKVAMLSRCRKDAKLCFPSTAKRRVYDERKFNPEEVRQDPNIPWLTKSFFYGGQRREMRYKEVNNVLWQKGTKRKPLRLIVLAPLPYVRGGKRNYRDPAYLLTTGLTVPIEVLIQAYLDRWQIEYNHRDEKSILGVGEAQVWNEVSVVKQPAFHVATYSALLMANVIAYNDQGHSDFGERPKWRKEPKRNTCRALVGLLRACLLEKPELIQDLGLTIPMISAILRHAA